MSDKAHPRGLPYVLPKRLQVDYYGPNPLVSNLSVTDPDRFALASERRPAPTLFASGDLPPFTASGVDPQTLALLPFHWRHFAASEPDSAEVLSLVERAAQDRDFPGAALPHNGLLDYEMRMTSWVAGIDPVDIELGSDNAYPDSFKTQSMRRFEGQT